MFTTHLFYIEGSRVGTVYPYCEKSNADQGISDGQCGLRLVSPEVKDISCPYCHWEKLNEIYTTVPGLPGMSLMLPIHYGIYPFFSRDGRVKLLQWRARCGIVKIYPELCLATRNPSEVSCRECSSTLIE